MTSDEIFKKFTGFSLRKVSLVRIHPHAFLSIIIFNIFVQKEPMFTLPDKDKRREDKQPRL